VPGRGKALATGIRTASPTRTLFGGHAGLAQDAGAIPVKLDVLTAGLTSLAQPQPFAPTSTLWPNLRSLAQLDALLLHRRIAHRIE
jgi:hypothetical protein